MRKKETSTLFISKKIKKGDKNAGCRRSNGIILVEREEYKTTMLFWVNKDRFINTVSDFDAN